MFNLNSTVMSRRKKNIIKEFILDVGNPQMTKMVFKDDLDGTAILPYSIFTNDIEKYHIGEEFKVRTALGIRLTQ